MPTLYAIANELLEILATAELPDGEISPALEDRLDGLQLDLRTKAENICRVMAELDGDHERYAREVARLAALAKSALAKRDRLKAYLRLQLEKVGLKKLDTDLFRLTIQSNSRPAIRLTPNAPIPIDFLRVRKEFDGDAAYQAWKSGEPLPADVVVELGSHLRIR